MHTEIASDNGALYARNRYSNDFGDWIAFFDVDPADRVIYALKLAGNYHGKIHKSDLAIESPYNSYIHLDTAPGTDCQSRRRIASCRAEPGKDRLPFLCIPQ